MKLREFFCKLLTNHGQREYRYKNSFAQASNPDIEIYCVLCGKKLGNL